MKFNKLTLGTAIAGLAVIAAAATLNGSTTLDNFASSLYGAKALDVTYTLTQVGGGTANYRVSLAKPNKARIDGPTELVVADGTNITVYNKQDKVFFKRPQTDAELRSFFNDPGVGTWSAFFNEKAFDNIASAKDAGERSRKGVNYKVVTAQADTRGEFVMTFYIDPKDMIARQAEFVSKSAGRSSTVILNTSSLSMTAQDSLFAFTAPAGSKEIDERDLIVGKWLHDFEEAKGIAKATGKIMMVDFMASWCGPCKMMDAEVFQSGRFKQEAKDFVLVKIDVDEQKGISSSYGVTAMPTVMFIDGDGKVVHKFVGYGGPDMVFGEMAKAKSMR